MPEAGSLSPVSGPLLSAHFARRRQKRIDL